MQNFGLIRVAREHSSKVREYESKCLRSTG